MGLTLHLDARAPATLHLGEIAARVQRWHDLANAFAATGRVDRVLAIRGDADHLERLATAWISLAVPDDPNTSTGVAVPPSEGRIFVVRIGKGCEPVVLGLCRYPGTVPAPGDAARQLPTGKEGWQLLASCKTQYASNHGWEHFRRCHLAAVELASAGSHLGLDVRIVDEGGYWPQRDEAALRASLDRHNGLLATFAGALRDANVDVQAPIFDHPRFEHLEAEGQSTADPRKIADAIHEIGKARRQARPDNEPT